MTLEHAKRLGVRQCSGVLTAAQGKRETVGGKVARDVRVRVARALATAAGATSTTNSKTNNLGRNQ